MSQKVIQKSKIELEYSQQLTQSLEKQKISVFLCGASIEDTPNFSPENSEEAVRCYVLQKLKEKKIPYYLGENQSLIEEGQKVLRGSFSLARHEISLYNHHYDLTVIFPCSAGSFAELGMFCLSKSAYRMLIIVDIKYENKPSYLNLGPIKEADLNKARVKYCNYNDLEEVWKLVDSEIINVQFTKLKSDYF